jgi:hypothetical protein
MLTHFIYLILQVLVSGETTHVGRQYHVKTRGLTAKRGGDLGDGQ